MSDRIYKEEKEPYRRLNRPPIVRPKSNDWRSVYLWQNTALNLRKKL